MRSGNYMQSSYYIVCVRHIAHIFNFGDNSQDNQLLIDAAKFGERTAVIGEAIITLLQYMYYTIISYQLYRN
jgi:hypothetical protein